MGRKGGHYIPNFVQHNTHSMIFRYLSVFVDTKVHKLVKLIVFNLLVIAYFSAVVDTSLLFLWLLVIAGYACSFPE